MTQKQEADIVVSVSGGIVDGIFGPKGTTVLVIDFDNLHTGYEFPSACELNGTVDSVVCQELIKEASEIQGPDHYCSACKVKDHDVCSMTRGCPCCEQTASQLGKSW